MAVALHPRGAQVWVHDPQAAKTPAASPTLDYTNAVQKASEQADLVLHLKELTKYRELDPTQLADVVRLPRLLVARNALDTGRWQSAGSTLRPQLISPLSRLRLISASADARSGKGPAKGSRWVTHLPSGRCMIMSPVMPPGTRAFGPGAVTGPPCGMLGMSGMF